jgi:hypothetical protein
VRRLRGLVWYCHSHGPTTSRLPVFRSSVRPKRQPLGRYCHSSTVDRPSVHDYGSQTSTAWAGIVTVTELGHSHGARNHGIEDVPNVNRLGRYCHSARRESYARACSRSQTSTAWAVPNVNRLGRYCHSHCLDRHCHRSNEWAMSKISTGPKRQPLKQGLPLASLVSQTSTAWAGIVSQVAAMGPSASAVSQTSTAWAGIVTRSALGLSQTSTAWAGIVTCDGAIFGIAVRPKRQPLGQVLSRSRSHSARPVRPKRQPLGQVLSQLRSRASVTGSRTSQTSTAWAGIGTPGVGGAPHRQVPNVNRLGRYCHSLQAARRSRPKRQPLGQALSPVHG